MPRLTRWFLRASLATFLVAMLLGVLIVARHPLGLAIPFEVFTPVFFHLFMVGWVAQLIFGIVFWMFPKFTKEQPRGSERLGWFTFASLNLGLLLRVVAEPGQAIQPAQVWSWMLVASAVLQWLAGLAFVLNTWARVKER